MRFNGWILSIVFALAGQQGWASAPECVSQAEMTEIASHFTQFRELANKGEYCLDGSQTSNLIASLLFMRKTAFAAPMPSSGDDLFSGRFSNDWYRYFIGRIDEMNVQSSCPKGVGAFVYFFGNTMYVCPMLLTDNFTALDRASVFMHEARHIDGFPHVTCRRGPRAGLQGACDQRMSDGGSYAVSVETYAQLAAYADIHPALKAYARASAVTYADEAFDEPTRVTRDEQLLVMTSDRGFHAVNPSRLTVKSLGESPALGRIVMRAQHMILFPDDRNLPARYVFARGEGEIAQQAGDIAMAYNAATPTQRADYVDVHIGTQWTAQVFRDRVRLGCDPRSDSSRDLSFNGDTAAGLIYPNGYQRGSANAHLIMASGRVMELGCDRSRGAYLQASSLSFDRPFKRVHKAGTEVVGLGADGRLYTIVNGRSQLFSTPFDGRIHDLVPNQAVSFFDRD